MNSWWLNIPCSDSNQPPGDASIQCAHHTDIKQNAPQKWALFLYISCQCFTFSTRKITNRTFLARKKKKNMGKTSLLIQGFSQLYITFRLFTLVFWYFCVGELSTHSVFVSIYIAYCIAYEYYLYIHFSANSLNKSHYNLQTIISSFKAVNYFAKRNAYKSESKECLTAVVWLKLAWYC